MIVRSLTVPFADRDGKTPSATAMEKLSLRLKTFRFLLNHCAPRQPGTTLVDLGAGHGLFSQTSRRAGYIVTAVDARPAWTLRMAAGLPPATSASMHHGLTGVTADVTHFDVSGFDVVLAIGLIYHLPLQTQLDLFRRSLGKPTIIDTEVFDPALPATALDPRLTPARTDGYDGALFAETGDLWSSAGNAQSFWFTHEALLSAFAAAGRSEIIVAEPCYRSRFGPRRWYVLDPAQ